MLHTPQSPSPKRRELFITRVANGWTIQPIAVAQHTNPETGQPYVSNLPEEVLIARTAEELADILVGWARGQVSSLPSTAAATTRGNVPFPGVTGMLGAQVGGSAISPDPSLLSRNRDD